MNKMPFSSLAMPVAIALSFICAEVSYGQISAALDSLRKNVTEEHKLLARSVGAWTGKASVWYASDKPPLTSNSLLNNHMDANGRFLISEIEGNIAGPGKPFTGVRITGYDPIRKLFTRAMIQDGSPGVVMEGKWDETTKSITMLYKQFDNKGKENSLKEVYTFVDIDTEVLEIFRQTAEAGKDPRVLKVVWTRKK